MRTRSTAALAALTLAASSAALLGSAGMSQAATDGKVTLNCKPIPVLGNKDFKAAFDTDAPATATQGDPVGNLMPTLDVDASAMQMAYNLGSARFYEGTTTYTVDVAGYEFTATSVTPKTPLPANGQIPVETPTLPLVGGLFHEAGAVEIKIVKMALKQSLTKADGTTPASVGGSIDATCLPTTTNTLIDTVTVAAKEGYVPPTKPTKPAPTPTPAAKTKTTLKVKAKALKKGKGKATVTVTGTSPSGKVTLKAKPKKGKAVKAKGTVSNGKATLKLKGLKKGKYKVTVSYAGDDKNEASTGKTTLKVKK